MYIQMISIHGLIRGENIEMGRDADTGGQVRYVVELIKNLSEFDEVEQVDLFTRQVRDKRVSPDYNRHIEKVNDKCRIVRLPCGGSKYIRKERLWPYLDDFVDAMISFTRGEGRTPSVVHGHYADAGYVGKEVASAFGVPFVYTGHSLGRSKAAYLEEKGWSREAINKEFNMDLRIRVEEACLAMADKIIIGTNHERKHQYERYDNAELPTYEVIPPGLALDRFFPFYDYELSPEAVPEQFKQARMRMTHELQRFFFHHDKPLILALCRPEQRKNISGLIEAYGEDKGLQAMANLAVFAGIRKDITEMGAGEQEVLTDMLLEMDRYDLYGKMAVPKRHDSETDVPELYRLVASQGGVFVNPTYIENFGLTLIESSAVGLPFVASENGGPKDIGANCDSGLLVDVSDHRALAEAIKSLVADRELWLEKSTNGVNKVREHYSWETHCRRYVDAMQGVVKKAAKSIMVKTTDDEPYGQRLSSMNRILISDIDNTLLGDDDALGQLAELLRGHRNDMGFGIASGRHVDLVREVMSEHGLEFDVLISAVGTEIHYGAELIYDKGWASHLRANWKPDRVREALDELPFLYQQKEPLSQTEFKVSYDLDSEEDPEEAIALVHDALAKAKVGYRLIFSHGTFLDVLPNRASKGKAVRYLSGKWNIPLDRIATAGDSGNDIDMLKGQTAGIVVGNHSEELEPLRQTSDRVYFAEAEYAAGILEGLKHYGFVNGD